MVDRALDSTRASGSLVLALALLLSCATPAAPAARACPCPANSSAPVASAAPAGPKPVPEPVDCTNDDQCRTRGGECVVSARCVASQCQMEFKPPRTRCALSGAQEGYQNVYLSERGEAGVCREGACIPRMQCAELCSVELGPKLWTKFKTTLDACNQRKPDSPHICDQETAESPAMQAEAKRVTDRCLVDCGFPDLDAMP